MSRSICNCWLGAGLEDPNGPVPPTRFLVDGHGGAFRVLITAAGSGYASFGSRALTAWRGDPIEDQDGWFIYLRDLDNGDVWSVGRQPLAGAPERYIPCWRPGVFEIERCEHGIVGELAICVPPGTAAELRRLSLTNRSGRSRRIEVTTYAEAVLDERAAHAAHPVFSKLFLQTEWVPGHTGLLVHRRRRAENERHPWFVHAFAGSRDSAGRVSGEPVQFETDRARFWGRRLPSRLPAALVSPAPLTGTTGSVLDPIVSLRRIVTLADGERVTMAFLLGAAWERDDALALVPRFACDVRVTESFAAAEAAARADLARLGVAVADAASWQGWAGAWLYGCPCPQLPDESATRAGAYFESLGLAGELGSLLAKATTGRDLRAAPVPASPDADAERNAAAGAAEEGPAATGYPPGEPTAEPLRLPNPYGGFSADGTEYVIRLHPDRDGVLALPPQPWTNVIANERFGFLVSESGAGCTWHGNSREHRLTPWLNDPVRDPHGEAFYVRDEESGDFWSLWPGPAPGGGAYEVRHGFGYSHCRREGNGLTTDTTFFVALHDPVRCAIIRITNQSARPRRLSAFTYYRLVLGTTAEAGRADIVTWQDEKLGALFARNARGGLFATAVAFAASGPMAAGALRVTTDRGGFVGKGGDLGAPTALCQGAPLGGRIGSGIDACFAQQVSVEVSAAGAHEVVFLLGEGDDADHAAALVSRYRTPGSAPRALEKTRSFWRGLLGRLRVCTPSEPLDVMVNGWLPYQTLSCRLWGRTAFYQSGGAFGFRDQLQDAAALIALEPELTRAQILLHAAHQFAEGDVLHWWHPPDDRGLRTRFADDLLWLPYVTACYVHATGDLDILAQTAPYLKARLLAPGEDEAFVAPQPSGETADLYDHCCRALDRSLVTGGRGLPLFGTGDWNDGMNRVGRDGRGESVWLGFFLYATLDGFIPLCESRGDAERVARYRAHRHRLQAALEKEGWDGAWYRRGWYDNGAPLGSRESDECRIDALAQAWAVISGAAAPARARAAMDAVEEHLISASDGVIRLLTPPFDRTPHDPGYIKGYVPGVRENGGQYTHAALWVVRAMAELGRRDRAAALLDLINPINHTRTRGAIERYKVEPYVVAADIYGAPPHVGRGGWTWYTGSSGWMYRVALESLLGFRLEAGVRLRVRPQVPDDWPGFRIEWRVPDEADTAAAGRETWYTVEVVNPGRRAVAVTKATLDGSPIMVEEGACVVPVVRDGHRHQVGIVLG